MYHQNNTGIHLSVDINEMQDDETGVLFYSIDGAISGTLEPDTVTALLAPVVSKALEDQIHKLGGIGALGGLFSKLRGGGK